MTNEEFAALQPGDVVTHEEDGPGVAWTVMQRDFNGTVIVAQVGSIIAPSQWSKLRRPPLADDRATAMAGALDPGLPAGNRRPELIRLQMHPGEAFATLHCGRLEVQVSATALHALTGYLRVGVNELTHVSRRLGQPVDILNDDALIETFERIENEAFAQSKLKRRQRFDAETDEAVAEIVRDLPPDAKHTFRMLLRAWFPWLESDEPVSGADAVDRLNELYVSLAETASKSRKERQ